MGVYKGNRCVYAESGKLQLTRLDQLASLGPPGLNRLPQIIAFIYHILQAKKIHVQLLIKNNNFRKQEQTWNNKRQTRINTWTTLTLCYLPVQTFMLLT